MATHGIDQDRVCTCKALYDPNRFMIECAFCDKWFHGMCVGVTELQALSISHFACVTCTKQGKKTQWVSAPKVSDGAVLPLPHRFGSMTLKELSSMYENDNSSVCVHKKSEDFRRRLRSGMFAKSGIKRIKGLNLCLSVIRKIGFDDPILVEDSEGLGLEVPPALSNTEEMESTIGSSHTIKMRDVESQVAKTMTMAEWVALKKGGGDVLNFDYKVEESRFQNAVVPPEVVCLMDWAVICPVPPMKSSLNLDKKPPETTPNPANPASDRLKYVYGVIEDTHTYKDFAIHPAGASYWYHLVQGEVSLYLVPPTKDNLEKFSQWLSSPVHASIFFGDVVDKCIQCELYPGNTIFIPAGWICASFTVLDSQGFAGHFLHGFHIARQFDVYEKEKKLGVNPFWPIKNVKQQTWYAVRHYISKLQQERSGAVDPEETLSEWERKGLASLLPILRTWYAGSGPANDTVTPLKLISALQHGLAGTAEKGSNPSVPSKIKISAGDDPLGSACKCHLKKCLSCRNCIKRHCSCTGNVQPLGPTEGTDTNLTSSSTTASSTSSPQDEMDCDFESSGSHHSPAYYSSDFLPDLEWPSGQSDSVWDDTLTQQIDPTGAFEFLADQDLGLGMGDIELSNTYIDLGDATPDDYDKGFISPRGSPSSTVSASVDAATKHRASCHRCGNLRKKNLRCSKCPHIFCQKCAEKMLAEHGLRAFDHGCPVCKELCCCGKNRCINCTRKYHCYKKCPLTKRGAMISPGVSKLGGDLHVARGPFALGGKDDVPAVAPQLSPQHLYKSDETGMDPSKLLASHISAEEEAMIFPDFTSGVIEDSLFPVSVGEIDCGRNELDAPTCFSDIDVELVDLEMP